MTAEPVSALSAPTLTADVPTGRSAAPTMPPAGLPAGLPAEPGPGHGARLLVVDDDPDVRLSLERALRMAGYAVTTAVHGADALDCLARTPVDLIVLDVMMPMVDGFEACRRLRGRGDATPILVLTARDTVDDRVTGLEVGADDYLVKPFALRELLARVRALLRRSQARRDVLGYADLTLDVSGHRVTRDGVAIELTRIEFGLLELLVRNAEQVLSYDVIRERVWGYGEAPASNALAVFVGFLRRKLEEGGRSRLVHNVRGVGYVVRTSP
jgi:two-component system, OmpR family, response regulator MprA